MINQFSIEAVANAAFGEAFCRPLYSSYCFSRIPATIKSLLGVKGQLPLPSDTTDEKEYEHAVLFFIDGFGWCFFEKFLEHSTFLQHIVKEGILSKLTSLFPSTTAAHVTCMNTGKAAGESGVYEWFYYEPLVDRLICPLTFSFAKDKGLGTLTKAGVKAEDLFPMRTLYEELKSEGVDSFVFLQKDIVDSPYSAAMLKGAEKVGYENFSDGLARLGQLQESQKGKKSYFYFYFPAIDSAGHHQGIDSPQFEAEIKKCLKTLDEEFYSRFEDGKVTQTACMITADHGMVSIYPKETIYLNRELPEIVDKCQKNGKGEILVPAGSCRDLFLHIREEYLEEVRDLINEKLKGRAAVFTTEELIREKFFGEGEVSKRFRDRVGNLVIVPYGTRSVWWYDKSRPLIHSHAMHGGLTRDEMEIPFLFLGF